MPPTSDAYLEPPRVTLFQGDIILSGPGCSAAYTADAARALHAALGEALIQAQAASDRPAGSPPR